MNRVEEIILGLQILVKHQDADICAEHDVIYARCYGELSEEEKLNLRQAGWSESQFGGYEHFV